MRYHHLDLGGRPACGKGSSLLSIDGFMVAEMVCERCSKALGRIQAPRREPEYRTPKRATFSVGPMSEQHRANVTAARRARPVKEKSDDGMADRRPSGPGAFHPWRRLRLLVGPRRRLHQGT